MLLLICNFIPVDRIQCKTVVDDIAFKMPCALQRDIKLFYNKKIFSKLKFC